LLERTELDEKQREYVDVITTSSKVLLSLINNILDYSKIESGVIELENISFSVPELVTKTVTILKPIAHEKGINFETRIADSIPRYTYGDPTKISQILMNLANNAIKFTNYGYTVVNVFPTSSDENSITIRFEVIDTGVGISDKAKSRIFERFMQEDESITRKFGGTGLGTAISKKLAEHMGGSIGVSSEEGVGSRFWFEIPLTITEAVHPVVTEQNVVVLSQNPEYIHTLKQTIEVWDYTVDIYPDSSKLQKLMNPGVDRVPAAIIVDYAIVDNVNSFIESLAENVTPNINFILLGPSKFSDKRVLELYDTILPTPIDTRELYQTLHFKSLAKDSVVTPIRVAKTYKKKLVKNLKTLNILVCDDEPTNRFVMKEIIESMSHNVTLAEDGYQALDLLQENDFDLAILDLQMPEISGLEVAEMYHYSEPENHVPMIMASANVRSEIIEKSRAYFDGFIDKPIDYQKLSALITKIIEEREKKTSNIQTDFSRALQTILFDTHELKMYPKQALEKDFLTSLFETFIENANRKIADIKYSIERQDIESFKSHVHAIKGIAGNVKAKRLVEMAALCEELDSEAFSNTNTTDYILDNLKNCLNDTKIVLFEYLKEENRKKG
jgi:two-component system sensor histidine kinase RpfC